MKQLSGFILALAIATAAFSSEAQTEIVTDSGLNISDLKTLTEEAQTYLTEVLPITHTLSTERVSEKTERVAENAEKLFQKVGAFKAELKARKRNLAITLVIIFINIGFLFLKRRSLDRA